MVLIHSFPFSPVYSLPPPSSSSQPLLSPHTPPSSLPPTLSILHAHFKHLACSIPLTGDRPPAQSAAKTGSPQRDSRFSKIQDSVFTCTDQDPAPRSFPPSPSLLPPSSSLPWLSFFTLYDTPFPACLISCHSYFLSFGQNFSCTK